MREYSIIYDQLLVDMNKSGTKDHVTTFTSSSDQNNDCNIVHKNNLVNISFYLNIAYLLFILSNTV